MRWILKIFIGTIHSGYREGSAHYLRFQVKMVVISVDVDWGLVEKEYVHGVTRRMVLSSSQP